MLAAIGLLAAGLAFKIAAFPFHAWAPDAYQGASAPVAAFLATASKVAGVAAVGRVCLVAFGPEAHVLSMVLAGLADTLHHCGEYHRPVANQHETSPGVFLDCTHAGYALLGFVSATSQSGTSDGTAATMTYVFLYVFMTLGAFGVVIALGQRGENLSGYEGLAAAAACNSCADAPFPLVVDRHPTHRRIRCQVRRNPGASCARAI